MLRQTNPMHLASNILELEPSIKYPKEDFEAVQESSKHTDVEPVDGTISQERKEIGFGRAEFLISGLCG